MKFYLFIVLTFIFLSCKRETLDPVNLKKVVIFQVNYNTYDFEGGKEFSYFEDDNSTVELPVTAFSIPPVPNGRLTILYTNDTIFDGFQLENGIGKRNYPKNIDNQIHYFRNEKALTRPDDNRFQIIFNDLLNEPIPYDSIWKNIGNLSLLYDYQTQNKEANIGIFLFRPSIGSMGSEDWKWYVVMKN